MTSIARCRARTCFIPCGSEIIRRRAARGVPSRYLRSMGMRFARPLFLIGLPIVALATLTGCSDPVAPPAQAAWSVSLNHDSVACEIASHNMMVGDVNDHERKTVVVDGIKGAQVDCT